MDDGRSGRRFSLGFAMRRLILAAAALLVLGAAPALISTPAWAGDEAAKAPQAENAIALSPVALPIVVDGRLANYVFVSVKVWLTPQADLFTLRDKEPYFRDALVRAAHRTPFVIKGDYNHVDVAKLTASLQRDAVAIVGPGLIRSVQVVEQTPQHRLPVPR